MSESISGPQLYVAGDDYRDQLLNSINHAQSRILLETMVLDQSKGMQEVLDACLRARKRGVGVLMIYDIFAHWDIALSQGPSQLRDFKSRITELQDEGAVLHQVGAKELNPFAGRHHAKAVLVDDHAYVGGGVNLTGASFETRDYMLRYDNAQLTQALYDTLPKGALDRSHDQIVYSDDTSEIILDAGNKHDSLIYERTCELAEQATKVWYVSKLPPDDKLIKILADKDVEYWFNSFKSASHFDKLAIFLDYAKTIIPNSYDGDEVLHAKFCVFEMPDGKYQAITGSHNFNSRGVSFGTQEIAIHTQDQALCDKLIDFAENLSDSDN